MVSSLLSNRNRARTTPNNRVEYTDAKNGTRGITYIPNAGSWAVANVAKKPIARGAIGTISVDARALILGGKTSLTPAISRGEDRLKTKGNTPK